MASRLALLVCLVHLAGLVTASLVLKDTFDATNFFDEFYFFEGPDPTRGYVNYLPEAAAKSSGIARYQDDQVILAVDAKTLHPSPGRASLRMTSKMNFTHGVVVADIAHMPGSICGTWPAFWSFGPWWPASGEIDIIEGINAQEGNHMALHTDPGCEVDNEGSRRGTLLSRKDCNAKEGEPGCGQTSTDPHSYGSGFNSIQGGVYVLDWTSTVISIYFFPRDSIPKDITTGKPDPESWGTPQARFTSTDFDYFIKEHNLVFNITFCGDLAGSKWKGSMCSALAPTCEAFVAEHPEAFEESYWAINSVKRYARQDTKGR